MNKSIISTLLFVLFVLLSPIAAIAALPAWQIVPADSSVTFTGTQNGAPATGGFKKFSGEIYFDPNQLADSKAKIVIDMNSVTTTYSDFTSTLLTSDWFNVKVFPQAIFEATHFAKMSDNKYSAEGVLTIRDKKIPVTLTFEAEKLSDKKGRVKGSATLKRTVFGIGQGEWADTDAVKDDVQVNFTITAVSK